MGLGTGNGEIPAASASMTKGEVRNRPHPTSTTPPTASYTRPFRHSLPTSRATDSGDRMCGLGDTSARAAGCDRAFGVL